MSKPRAVGIDLGTTYSVVACLDDMGRTQVVRGTDGDLLTPSVVLFEKDEVIVGREAKKASAPRSGAVAEFVKRDMGKEWYSREIHGEKLHPEVIQAYILKKLKDDAAAALGPDFQVVITVPAYFDEPRRKATADAGEMAGLAVLDIVNEPTAAALSFGESLGYLTEEGQPGRPMKVFVYDLGGGTFDVTVLDLRPGDLRTLATDGDVQLGGYDWDMRMVNFAAERFMARYQSDPRQTPPSLAALLAAVEEAKHTLTARPKTTLLVRHAGESLELTVTREQFEELTEDLLERTAYTTRQVLAAAKVTWAEVDRVLLVGGSTRMPMVSRMIEQLSGLKPDHTVHADEAVARGAAIFAGYLLRHRDPTAKPGFKVVDVNAHSLGIEGIDQRTMRKQNVVIIPRNTPLPAKVTEKFVTKIEDQPSIVVKVLEGESKAPEQCSSIGRAVLRNLPEHLPKGWPIEVTYAYLTNGRLDVHAKLPGAGKELELELQREQAMTSERLGEWKAVVAAAKGFDAFDDLLDDVVHQHRKERRKETKKAAVSSGGAADGGGAAASAAPERDLSAASRAFAEMGGRAKETPRPAAAAPTRPAAEPTAATKAVSPAPTAAAAIAKPAAKPPVSATPASKPAPTPAAPPAATADAKPAKPVKPAKPAWKEPAAAEETADESAGSTPKWVLAAGMLGTSALVIAACYYIYKLFFAHR